MKQDLANTKTWPLHLLRTCLRLCAELLLKNNFLIKKKLNPWPLKKKKSQFNDFATLRCNDKYMCIFIT